MKYKIVIKNQNKKLNNLCLKSGVTVIQTTPTKLKMLLNKTEYIYKMKKILKRGVCITLIYLIAIGCTLMLTNRIERLEAATIKNGMNQIR